jgi:hypothetical protein
MQPVGWLVRQVVGVAHEAVAEWRRLDAPPAEPAKQELSCTSAGLRDAWQPVTRAPASPRAVGFGPPVVMHICKCRPQPEPTPCPSCGT